MTISVFESRDNSELIAGCSRRLDVSFLVGPVTDDRLTLHQVCADPFVVMLAADAAQRTSRRCGSPISRAPRSSVTRRASVTRWSRKACARRASPHGMCSGATTTPRFRPWFAREWASPSCRCWRSTRRIRRSGSSPRACAPATIHPHRRPRRPAGADGGPVHAAVAGGRTVGRSRRALTAESELVERGYGLAPPGRLRIQPRAQPSSRRQHVQRTAQPVLGQDEVVERSFDDEFDCAVS